MDCCRMPGCAPMSEPVRGLSRLPRTAWSSPARWPNGRAGPACALSAAAIMQCLARCHHCTSRASRTMPFMSNPIFGCITAFAEATMSADYLGPYRVTAFNTAHDSENKIHDDATARRFGFGGGLVPGVDVYGYMSHLPVTRWGRAWLERGSAECRFLKPVYDGDTATVTARDDSGVLEITVESRGEVCATGRAMLPATLPAPSLGEFHNVPQRP